MVYQREWWGKGSPSLHSNIFRYALLHKLGGWWIDLDVLLLRKDLPLGDDFYAKDYQNLVSTAALKLPCGHPLLADAIERSKRVSEPSAEWGQTGPNLMTKLVAEHGLTGRINPTHVLSPLDYHEIAAVFDPERNEQVRDRCREAAFIHLFNQLCSAAGVPRDAGPPVGSFIAQKFTEHDPGVKFTYRIQFADLSRWIQNFLGHQYYENLYRTMR